MTCAFTRLSAQAGEASATTDGTRIRVEYRRDSILGSGDVDAAGLRLEWIVGIPCRRAMSGGWLRVSECVRL